MGGSRTQPYRLKLLRPESGQSGIGSRIRVFREYRELSRAELARLCACRESELADYETNQRPVPPHRLRRIAQALGFPPSAFATAAPRQPGLPPDDFELERIAFLFSQIESEAERSKLLRTVARLMEEALVKPH